MSSLDGEPPYLYVIQTSSQYPPTKPGLPVSLLQNPHLQAACSIESN